MYEPSETRLTIDYLECNADGEDAAQWSRVTLMERDHAPESVAIRVDGEGRVGMAVGQSNGLWYLQCPAICSELTSWQSRHWPGLTGNSQDADLTFDPPNGRHIALRSNGGDLGWGCGTCGVSPSALRRPRSGSTR
jgi:hypothetical protein